MKKLLMALAISSVFLSCKSKTKADLSIDKNMVMTDTALLNRSGIYADTAIKAGVVKNADGTVTTTTVITKTTSPAGATTNDASTKNSNDTKPTASTTTSVNSGSATTKAPVKKDKGWSSAAKGTAIGAGSGAILGAVVSKDKVKGAVVGGVVGAAGGYVIGRDMDKKSGRVARSKQ